MIVSTPIRWYRLTPDRLVMVLLVMECLLWLSERFRYFGFNQHKGWTVLIAVAVVGVAMLFMLGWFVVSLVFRWRFQFSIRSLMVLVVIVAIPCSWLAVEIKKAREQQEVVNEIPYVIYDFENHDAEPRPLWVRHLLGDDFFGSPVQANPSTSDTDARLEHISGLSQLEGLRLMDTEITDAGLAHLQGLTKLRWLQLDNTAVTDAGLKHLRGVTGLEYLGLNNTHITDVGLAYLAGLPHLRELNLNFTKVTDGGVKTLQRALPNCHIEY